MDFTKNDWGLINDLINVAWQAGAVKNPQMAQAIENLRGKVISRVEAAEKPKPESKPKDAGK